MTKIIQIFQEPEKQELIEEIIKVLQRENIGDFMFFYMEEDTPTSKRWWADDYQLAGMLHSFINNHLLLTEWE